MRILIRLHRCPAASFPLSVVCLTFGHNPHSITLQLCRLSIRPSAVHLCLLPKKTFVIMSIGFTRYWWGSARTKVKYTQKRPIWGTSATSGSPDKSILSIKIKNYTPQSMAKLVCSVSGSNGHYYRGAFWLYIVTDPLVSHQQSLDQSTSVTSSSFRLKFLQNLYNPQDVPLCEFSRPDPWESG